MVWEAARTLKNSVLFCLHVSRELQSFVKASGSPERDILAVARSLIDLAERDAEQLRDFTDSHDKVPVAPWWLLANLAIGLVLALQGVSPFGLRSVTVLVAAMNVWSLLVKTRGTTFRNASRTCLQAYLSSQLKLVLAACVFIAPMILLNFPFWLVVHFTVSATASWWPAFMLQQLASSSMERLCMVFMSCWLLWKSAMLIEVLVHHDYYRTALAKRRHGAMPTLGYHVADAIYGFSYSVLGFQLGCLATCCCAHVALLAFPNSWSLLGMLLLQGLRASVAPSAYGAKTVMHWSMHRLLHVQPFYTCWHKEHHFSASQTCLTACHDCGLLEICAEAPYLQLCFIFVPFYDQCAYAWTTIFNSLAHHYYEEYRHVHWKMAGHMLQVQKYARSLVSHIEFGKSISRCLPFVPFRPIFAENLQYPAAAYAPAAPGNGPIELHWHGQHHWTSEKHFGYGTWDSVSNLGSDPSLPKPEKEKELVKFLEEYLKVVSGRLQVLSIATSSK
mmetsp:Transcript_37122/g.85798  ORF Transcript_37122/g.85798 Transcript_37122/m.85798 type:complete len:503 (+) Transcript_37122:44-1552(+)